jgi:hypothetical protein
MRFGDPAGAYIKFTESEGVTIAGSVSISGTATIGGESATTVKDGAAAGATAQQNTSDKTAGKVGGWKIDSDSIFIGTKDTSGYSTAGITLYSGGSIHAPNFYIDTAGSASFRGTISAGSGNIGGWAIGNTFLSSSNGKIIFDSATPEISYTGGTNANFKLSTGLINAMAQESEPLVNTAYMGDGGMIFLGTRDGAGNLKNQIRIDNYGDYTRMYIAAENTTYTDEIVWINKITDVNSAALKVQGGGIEVNASGTANHGHAIYSGGSATFGGDVIANTSDGRLKTNIKNIDSPLEKISKINGIYFNWNELAKELTDKDTTKREVGFIAQEVQTIMPEIIKPAAFDLKLKTGENYLTIQYEKIVPLLVECIKELKSEIEELKKNR